MIDLSRFNVLVTHANCADGIAAAMVARTRQQLVVAFCNYDDDAHRKWNPAPDILWVDMTPHRDSIETTGTIPGMCIDHHSGARDICERFESHIFHKEGPGISGSMLLLDAVAPLSGERASLSERNIVELVGIYDSWDVDNPRWLTASKVAGAMKLWPLDVLLGQWGDQRLVDALLPCGEGLLDQQKARLRTIERGMRYYPSLKIAIVQADSSDTSLFAGRLAKEGKAFVTVGFAATVRDGVAGYMLCLRSSLMPDRSYVDVEKIATKHGGGGHPSSAGCWVDAGRKDPWNRIMEVLGV